VNVALQERRRRLAARVVRRDRVADLHGFLEHEAWPVRAEDQPPLTAASAFAEHRRQAPMTSPGALTAAIIAISFLVSGSLVYGAAWRRGWSRTSSRQRNA